MWKDMSNCVHYDKYNGMYVEHHDTCLDDLYAREECVKQVARTISAFQFQLQTTVNQLSDVLAGKVKQFLQKE